MARSLKFWLAAPDLTPLDRADVPLALGALLVRVARADFAYLLCEIEAIDAILALRHDLTSREAAEMRETCELIEALAPDTARFAEVLRAAVDYHDRLAIALCLWEVMMADGIRRSEEAEIVELAETVLGVRGRDLSAPRTRAV